MRRRDFITFLGGAAAVLSLAAVAADKLFRVGIASLVNPRSAPQFQAFEQRLHELESDAGQDFAVDFELLDGNADSFPNAMHGLINRGADVLLAPGQEVALRAARAATRTIPIVMVAIDYDPVALGYAVRLSKVAHSRRCTCSGKTAGSGRHPDKKLSLCEMRAVFKFRPCVIRPIPCPRSQLQCEV